MRAAPGQGVRSRVLRPPLRGGPAAGEDWRDGGGVQVAEAAGRALEGFGVAAAFGVLGSGNLVLANALRDTGVTFVHARHECAAVSMADAYARVTRTVGVATVHQGPGLTNALTGLAEAAKARTPLLLLAADTSTGAVASNFRIDQAGLAAAIGAVPERVHSPATALADLARAYRTAVTGRQAVLVSLPLDVQAAPAALDAVEPPLSPARPAPAGAAVEAAADLLAGARRPALIAGRGAVLADAREPLEALADRVGALLATSANGHGLFAGSPYALGISGGFASPAAAAAMREADVVVAFGASLNMWTTRHGTLIGPAVRLVQVDLDAEAIGTHRPVDVGVVGDAALAARALDAALAARGHRSTGFREQVTAPIPGWRDVAYDDAGGEEGVDPRALTIALDDLLPADRTVVVDSGHFMGWPAMYLAVPDPAGFVFTQSFQSVGLGLGAAIGAAVARPDRLTVGAVGDGGALMAAGELETAARLRLPLLVVVYNDRAYGAEVHHFAPDGHAVDLVEFADTDFAALGRAAGGEGLTVRRLDDLSAVTDWLSRRDRPLVVDAKIAPGVVADWLEEAFRAH